MAVIVCGLSRADYLLVTLILMGPLAAMMLVLVRVLLIFNALKPLAVTNLAGGVLLSMNRGHLNTVGRVIFVVR